MREAGHIEQAIEQLGHVIDLARQDLADPRDPRVGIGQRAQQRGGIEDRRQRVAQLVAEHGDEGVLLPAFALELSLVLALLGHVATGDEKDFLPRA